ncbi:MBL fold metallo-hydrolase [Patescibacteria group bacterium]|nr:MBL fold metallo-hydrolase [Patescibacteria group bacterium]MBU1016503.1 MBL fold metallo-hydrolase [Patescibacteria group bacterium]MBU1685118.1 MBL fold metallo-hydrolase [Patescibacteria group bacterium]MBU1938618.1 MBL fold metallo-hydrolase [Patescibacteria group bacterium]
MEIKFYGHACFSVTEGGVTLVTDPFQEEIGLKLPTLSADAVTVSHNASPYNNVDAVEGDPKVFSWPGEYETRGIHFKMIHSFHNQKEDKEQLENNITVINWANIRLCHLGAQGTKLTPEQLEQVGEVGILFVPVGGKGCLEPKKAKEVIEQIEPRIIIPMCYNTEGSKLDLNSRDAFLSVMGAKADEPLDSFKVKRSELPEDNSKLVVLNVVE